MTLVAAFLAGLAAWWWLPVAPEHRLVRVGRPRPGPSRAGSGGTIRWSSAVAAAAAAWFVVGGIAGAVVGAAALVLVPRLIARLEPGAARARREHLVRQAPLLADLLAATLASGATLRDAIEVSARAVGEPTSSMLAPVIGAIDLGADSVQAWSGVDLPEEHRSLVDALSRAHRSGAPASGTLARAAEDLRRAHRRDVEVAARAAGVRAVAPLAACFLPAFLLLGVVPVVASLAAGLLSLG